jgi:hypothetical protein
MTRQKLSRVELEALHSVLRRAAERAERNREFELAKKLAEELAVLDHDIMKVW